MKLTDIIGVVLICVSLLGFVYYWHRIDYTYRARHNALVALKLFLDDVIENGEYSYEIHYWETMLVPYYKLLFSFSWNKYGAVRPEYRRLLLPYFNKLLI